jgi:hexulose-6-phosphate isomerase
MIDAAAFFGAGDVLIVPAVIDGETPYRDGYERAFAAVRHLARYSAETDVHVAIENVENDFLLSPLAFAGFVDEAAGTGPVTAYFDVGNGERFGRPADWLRVLGDRTSKIHVEDWRHDDGMQTYPLQGDAEWDAVRNALSDVGFDGRITAEVPPSRTRGGRDARTGSRKLRSFSRSYSAITAERIG